MNPILPPIIEEGKPWEGLYQFLKDFDNYQPGYFKYQIRKNESGLNVFCLPKEDPAQMCQPFLDDPNFDLIPVEFAIKIFDQINDEKSRFSEKIVNRLIQAPSFQKVPSQTIQRVLSGRVHFYSLLKTDQAKEAATVEQVVCGLFNEDDPFFFSLLEYPVLKNIEPEPLKNLVVHLATRGATAPLRALLNSPLNREMTNEIVRYAIQKTIEVKKESTLSLLIKEVNHFALTNLLVDLSDNPDSLKTVFNLPESKEIPSWALVKSLEGRKSYLPKESVSLIRSHPNYPWIDPLRCDEGAEQCCAGCLSFFIGIGHCCSAFKDFTLCIGHCCAGSFCCLFPCKFC